MDHCVLQDAAVYGFRNEAILRAPIVRLHRIYTGLYIVHRAFAFAGRPILR